MTTKIDINNIYPPENEIRTDLTSVPSNCTPASKVSKIS